MERFPTTQWTIIADLAGQDVGLRLAAVESFLRLYQAPLKAYLDWRFRSLQPDVREDLMQGFFADKVLAQKLFEHAVDHASRFRPYLKRVLANYVLDKLRVSPPAGMELSEVLNTVSDPVAADPFDVEWARTVIFEALQRTRDECYDSGRLLIWDIFDLRVSRPIFYQQPAVEFKDLSARFGRSERELRNLLVTAKRMLRRHLLDIVRGYTRSDERAMEEVRELQAIVAQPLAERVHG